MASGTRMLRNLREIMFSGVRLLLIFKGLLSRVREHGGAWRNLQEIVVSETAILRNVQGILASDTRIWCNMV